MALAPFKIFTSGEILTAADLNLTFSTLTDGGEDLPFPRTKFADFNGQQLILDANADTHLTVDTDDQMDWALGGTDYFRMRLEGSIPEFRAEWADAGATEGPYISTYRNSASPADDDLIGGFRILGENDAGETVAYCTILGQIADTTDGTEDGRIIFNHMNGGGLDEILRLGAGHLFILQSDDAGAADDPEWVLYRNSASPAADDKIGVEVWRGKNSAAEDVEYAKLRAIIEDPTNGSEDGYLEFEVIRAGAAVTSLSPGILYAPVATTSGTSHSFSIPAGARKIYVGLEAISTNSTSRLILQLNGQTTGYLGGCRNDIGTTSGNDEGIDLNTSSAAAEGYYGLVILTHMGNDIWTAQGSISVSDGSSRFIVNGLIDLAAELSSIALTSETPDTFDGGSVNILVK